MQIRRGSTTVIPNQTPLDGTLTHRGTKRSSPDLPSARSRSTGSMSTTSKNIGPQPQHDDEASSHERDGAESERHKANLHRIPPSVEGKLYHDECIFASCLLLLFCTVAVRSWYFTAFARTFYVCFHQDQDR